MAAPVRTPEQRATALEAAMRARRFRAALRADLKSGAQDPAVVVRDGAHDEQLAGVRVRWLLESLPGIGPVRAEQLMDQLGIAATRRLGGLNSRQRELLCTALDA